MDLYFRLSILRIYIFDWVYCLCCKTSRFWMNLVRCASFRMSFLLLIDIQSSWADTWESQWILPSTMLDLNMKDTCFKRSMRRSIHMCVELTGWAQPISHWALECLRATTHRGGRCTCVALANAASIFYIRVMAIFPGFAATLLHESSW